MGKKNKLPFLNHINKPTKKHGKRTFHEKAVDGIRSKIDPIKKQIKKTIKFGGNRKKDVYACLNCSHKTVTRIKKCPICHWPVEKI